MNSPPALNSLTLPLAPSLKYKGRGNWLEILKKHTTSPWHFGQGTPPPGGGES